MFEKKLVINIRNQCIFRGLFLIFSMCKDFFDKLYVEITKNELHIHLLLREIKFNSKYFWNLQSLSETTRSFNIALWFGM